MPRIRIAYEQQIDYIEETESKKMDIQNQLCEVRSLAPVEALCPNHSIQERPWYKVYRAECMIPFPMYSIKIVYTITFIAFKVYGRIDLYLIPMVHPSEMPIQFAEGINMEIMGRDGQIPIASYSFNCIYCARCSLGYPCHSHVPGFANPNQNDPNFQNN